MDETAALAAALCQTQDYCDGTCPDFSGTSDIHGSDAAAILAALHEQGYTIVRQDAPLDVERLREAVIHAAFDVDGLWFPQDDNWTGTDLTFWGPEAGEALRDLRAAIEAMGDDKPWYSVLREADTPIRTVTTPDGQVYRPVAREYDR